MITHFFTATACRSFVGPLLLLSGGMKARNTSDFAQIVREFSLLPEPLVNSTARMLPIVELLTGGGLLVSIAVPDDPIRWFGVVAAALFAVFAGAVAINVARGR